VTAADPTGQSRTALRHLVVLAALACTLLSACGHSVQKAETTTAPNTGQPAAVTVGYAAEMGGLDKLAAAAQKEGKLNVIGLPSHWANYGELLARFQRRYRIAVRSRMPGASSRAELAAATQLAGTSTAPDVLDLSASVAAANEARLAPYKVTTWGDVPDSVKDPGGRYAGGYGGMMSIGYDAKRVPAPSTLAALLGPAYRGKVAVNGDPTRSSSAFYAVVMAALANGGSADDIGPGVDFFARLKQAGNVTGIPPTTATISAGQTPVVLDWDYTNVQRSAVLPAKVGWRVIIPRHAVVGSYYVQAINIDAPHPAAARLWQEFLFSDEGQNLWLSSSVRPARADAMRASGTLDQAEYARLPASPGAAVLLSAPQLAKAKKYLTDNWSKAVG
jgi:putative spermidine/putrescine transport system substrate-binding protein